MTAPAEESEPRLALPATETAVRGGAGRRVLSRLGSNDWAFVVDDDADLAPGTASALAAVGGQRDGAAGLLAAAAGSAEGARRRLVARLELDECGLWATLACAGHPLPVVVRRAGWVDVRGQAAPPWDSAMTPESVGEDRVGLGPGDALVVVSSAVADAAGADGERFGDEALLTALVASVAPAAVAVPAPGEPDPASAAPRPAPPRPTAAETLADALLDALAAHHGVVPSEAAVTVLRVPDDAGSDPAARLHAALEVPPGAPLLLPGYRVGEPSWSPRRRPDPPRHARIVLPAEPVAAPTARRFVVGVLHSWRLSELVDDDDAGVELVTSELVGNAIRHGGSPFSVLVGRDGQRVRVAVGDGSRALPQPRTATLDDDGGRGLVLVEALAAATGVTPTVDGKRVWAEFPVPPVAAVEG